MRENDGGGKFCKHICNVTVCPPEHYYMLIKLKRFINFERKETLFIIFP
jgi:hypothetical protein